MLKRLFFTFWLSLVLLLPAAARAQTQAAPVLVITLDGPLTPSMQSYLQRGIRTAEQDGAEALIVELNTPGGDITLMNAMVQDIRASSVPVIVYVAPRGAWAGSAGTVITVAGHASAMAPETAIGAASPVGPQGEDLGTTIAAKEKNILKATVRSLAAGRSEQAIALAESTIESAQAASATEALQVGLVDFIATDLNDLLRQLDGFRVVTASGPHVLHTAGVVPTPLSSNFIESLLATLTDPNIVFVLLAVGVQAILIELSSPGGWIAGFVGVVCLALATYGLGVLPVNWFGMIFIVTAFVLFILDIKAPTHGALTVAGVTSLIVGSMVLFNSPGVPSFQRVSVPLIIGTSSFTGLLFFGILIFALRAQRLPVRYGQESLVGKTGQARSELKPTGMVQLGSELWSAELVEGEEPLPKGARVVVERVEGLRLRVRKTV